MEIPRLPAPLSLLDHWISRRMSMSLRLSCLLAKQASIISALVCFSHAAVNVSISTSAPASLQADFLAFTTNQFVSTVKTSPYFSNTYSVTLHAKSQDYIPPSVSSPILTGTAFDHCFVYGYAFGMEDERKDDIWLLKGLRDDVLITNTCGGLIAGTTVAADAFLNGCYTAYGVGISTISQRDGMAPTMIMVR